MRKPTSNADTRPIASPLPRGRRGVAMLMVLAVVAVTVLIAYAALSSSTLQAQGVDERRRASEIDRSAQNGARLAMHYLLRPDTADSLVLGAGGDTHWAGAEDLTLADGELTDVEVTNPAPGEFDVLSTTHDASGRSRAVRAKLRRTSTTWEAKAPLQLSRTTRLRSTVTVNGDAWFAGSYDGGGTITGTIYATNYTTPPEGEPVPAFDSLTLVQAGRSDMKYAYDGQVYQGEQLPSTNFETPPPYNPDNPARVYFYFGGSNLTFRLNNGTVFNGTIVVLNSGAEVHTSWTVDPVDGMPALIVEGDLWLDSDAKTIAKGLVYLNGRVRGSNPLAILDAHGAVLTNTDALGFAAGCYGKINLNWNTTHASAPTLVSQPSGLNVVSWELE